MDNLTDKRWCVYVHTNKTNGKKYVGITCRTPDQRWLKGRGYCGQPFYNAILKYGWDGFEHEIVAYNLTSDQAENMEMELIEKYHSLVHDNGYNVCKSGVAQEKEIQICRDLSSRNPIYQFDKNGKYIDRYDRANIAAKKYDISSRGILDVCRGKLKSYKGYIWKFVKNVPDIAAFEVYMQQHPLRSVNTLSVYQFDKFGHFIKEHPNYIEAAKEIGCDPACIRFCCRGQSQSSYGYIWRFKEDYEENPYIKPIYGNRARSILQYDLDGNYITEYPSELLAANKLGIAKSNFAAVCNGKISMLGGFMWHYRDEFDKIPMKIEPYRNKWCKCIYQYDLNMTFINKYDSIKEAAKATGTDPSGITKMLHGKIKTCGGYIWIYADDVPHTKDNITKEA